MFQHPYAVDIGGSTSQPETTETTTTDGSHAHSDDYLHKSGDTMSGTLNMATNKIINIADPTADTDATTKKYSSNATNLTTGTINKDRLPTTHNAIALNGNRLWLTNQNDTNGFIQKSTFTNLNLDCLLINGLKGVVIQVDPESGSTNRDCITITGGSVLIHNKALQGIKDPVNDSDASNKKYSSNATNLTTGTLNKDRLPSAFNEFSMEGRRIKLGNTSTTSNTIFYTTFNNKEYVQIESTDAIALGHHNKECITIIDGKNYLRVPTEIESQLNMKNNRITNLANPIALTDSVTKQYLDNY